MQAIVLSVLAAIAVDAPVSEVTVFSDRARVTRVGRVILSGTQAVALPLLNDRIDPATIRVEAQGAEVVRVDIVREEPDAVPADEARKLLAEINALDDELTRKHEEVSALQQQVDALSRIAPQVPQGDPLRPPPRLESSGWLTAVSFIHDASERAQARVRALSREIEKLEERRTELQEKARILGGAGRRGGYRVTPTLAGKGTATVRLTYFAGPARWYPSYDLQLAPEKGRVQVAFSGLVSQETGEDWTDATVTLSTAAPATAMAMPELTSWKIGERDRFIPTPRPKPLATRPPPSAPPLVPEVTEAEILRDRLMAAAQGGRGLYGAAAGSARPASRPQVQSGKATRAPAPPPPSVARPPPERPSFAAAEAESSAFEDDAEAIPAVSTANRGARSVPTSAFNLAPPGVYRPPTYSPDLPISLAGGYDLAWRSLQQETIQSGKGARRVALFAQSWPVSVERRVYPALAPEAYLVAQLKSPSPTPLPGGNAQLFVGADPAGTARLELVSPGETFTLPLGIDRAIKPIRNVELVTTEKGLVGKDDVNTYVVRTELANPYPFPIFVKIFDQWPRTKDEEVEIELTETKPYALQDPVTGQLEWHLTIPASKKIEVSYTYTIRRPKNWRLHQR